MATDNKPRPLFKIAVHGKFEKGNKGSQNISLVKILNKFDCKKKKRKELYL